MTVSGEFLGTLRYVAPEQAQGHHSIVDQRTDVYSLGATLYELLTLRPAVRGKSRQEILYSLLSGEVQAPRSLNRGTPRDLDTIVLKAMEAAPGDRYATAGELAADLGRFLNQEPIAAARPTTFQRVVKWIRRHKAVAQALGLGFLLTFVVLIAALVWVWRENVETKRAYEQANRERIAKQAALVRAQEKEAESLKSAREAKEERDKAQEHFQRAAELIRTYGPLIYRLWKDGKPELATSLASETVDVLDVSLLKGKEKLTASRNVGWHLSRLGDLLMHTGHFQKAAEAYSFSVEAFKEFHSGPNKLAWGEQWELGHNLYKLAFAQHRSGQYDKARTTYQRCLSFLHAAVSSAEKLFVVSVIERDWCRARLDRALLLSETGKDREAERELQQTVADLERLALIPDAFGVAPSLPSAELIRGRYLRACHVWKTGKKAEASRQCRQIRASINTLLSDYPIAGLDPRSQQWLAWILVTCPDPAQLDPQLALKLMINAEKAETNWFTDVASGGPTSFAHHRRVLVGDWWSTLGIAHYRAGNYKDCRIALERNMSWRAPKCEDLFFLAMASWKMNQEPHARATYQAAVKEIKTHPKSQETLQFRAEAEAILEPAKEEQKLK